MDGIHLNGGDHSGSWPVDPEVDDWIDVLSQVRLEPNPAVGLPDLGSVDEYCSAQEDDSASSSDVSEPVDIARGSDVKPKAEPGLDVQTERKTKVERLKPKPFYQFPDDATNGNSN